MESIGKAKKVVRRNFISVLGNGEKSNESGMENGMKRIHKKC